MKQKYVIKLTETERSQLKELISSGEASARQIRRACILLKSDSSEGGPILLCSYQTKTFLS